MANELQVPINPITFIKGSSNVTLPAKVNSITVSGKHYVRKTQTIGTTDETLDLGDIGTIGVVVLTNQDATNYILIGPDGSSYPIRLKPGEGFPFRWNGAAIHAKANSAPCDLEQLIVED